MSSDRTARIALSLLLLGVLLGVGFVTDSSAQPDPILSSVSGGPGTLSVCPAGDMPLSLSTGLPIIVEVRNASGAPITNITAGEFEVDGVPPGLMGDGRDGLGSGPTHDVLSVTVLGPGLYELGAALLAGGVGSAVDVKVRGVRIVTGAPLPVGFVSPDLTGDGRVDLSDVSRFAILIYSPTYEPGCDIRPDGQCNIADISNLAIHVGHQLPAGYAVDVVD